MKTNTLAKLALNADIDFQIKGNLTKYINKKFKGDINHLKSNSRLVKDLLEPKLKQS